MGNSPGTGEFLAQMASNAENVSIWWRHHEIDFFQHVGRERWYVFMYSSNVLVIDVYYLICDIHDYLLYNITHIALFLLFIHFIDFILFYLCIDIFIYFIFWRGGWFR